MMPFLQYRMVLRLYSPVQGHLAFFLNDQSCYDSNVYNVPLFNSTVP